MNTAELTNWVARVSTVIEPERREDLLKALKRLEHIERLTGLLFSEHFPVSGVGTEGVYGHKSLEKRVAERIKTTQKLLELLK